MQVFAARFPDDRASEAAQALRVAVDALPPEHAQGLPARADAAMAAEVGAGRGRLRALPARYGHRTVTRPEMDGRYSRINFKNPPYLID
jgi:hypothetical protein